MIYIILATVGAIVVLGGAMLVVGFYQRFKNDDLKVGVDLLND